MVQATPPITKPKELFKFLIKIRNGIEEPLNTTGIFIKNTLEALNFWTDHEGLAQKSLWFKIVLFLNHLAFPALTAVMCGPLFVGHFDIFEFGRTFSYGIASLQCSVKFFFIQTNRKDISYLINTLNFKSQKLLEETKTNKSVKLLRNQYFLDEMTVTLIFLGFGILTILILISQILMPFPPKLPVNTLFPFDTTPGKGYGFAIAYIFISVTLLQYCTSYTLIDGAIGCNYNQVVLHFEILGMKLKAIGHSEKDEYKNQPDKFNRACSKSLRNIIDEYKELEEIVHQFNKIMAPFFWFLVVVTMVFFVFLTFITSITLHKNRSLFLIFVTFLAYVVAMFFFWSFLGARLEYRSSELLRDAYFCNWMECDQKFQKDLLKFMIRINKPLRYYAYPMFIFNYDMFNSYTRKAFSYFAVLQDINSKN